MRASTKQPDRQRPPWPLPTSAIEQYERLLVGSALTDAETHDVLDMIELLDAIGAEAANTLHLTAEEVAAAAKADAATSVAWRRAA